MNKTESSFLGLFICILIFLVQLGIFYYLMLDNGVIITNQFHYDLAPVKHNIFWFFIGWDMLSSIGSGLKIYNYARRGKSVDA